MLNIHINFLIFSALRMNKKKLYVNATIDLVVMEYERDRAQIGLLQESF